MTHQQHLSLRAGIPTANDAGAGGLLARARVTWRTKG